MLEARRRIGTASNRSACWVEMNVISVRSSWACRIQQPAARVRVHGPWVPFPVWRSACIKQKVAQALFLRNLKKVQLGKSGLAAGAAEKRCVFTHAEECCWSCM